MLSSTLFLQLSFIIFIATIFRSSFGFGESLVAVPLLALFIPIKTVVPLSVLLSITIAGFIVIQDKEKIHVRSAGGLILYAIIGIPLGLVLLIHINEYIVKIFLSIIIISFSFFLLSGKRLSELKTDNHLWIFGCGFLSGVFGGAYGLNGPPLLIYGAKRRWSAQHFRATLQAYFLITSLVGFIAYWVIGLIHLIVFQYYLFSIPAIIPAILIGRIVNHRLSGNNFFRYAYLVLLCIGILLLINTLCRVSFKT